MAHDGDAVGSRRTTVAAADETEATSLAPGDSTRPRRVLLVENTVRGLGGSYESLFVTASSLDKTRFEPIPLFFQPNHFAEKLEALGIRVLLAKSAHFWEKKRYIEKSTQVRARLPRGGVLGALRRRVVAFLRAIVGGIPMAWSVYKILRRERIDLLHSNNNLQRDSMVILAGLVAGVPVVAHERQLTRCSLLTRILSSRVRALVCISGTVLEFAKTSGARTADRRCIYNAVDVKGLRAVQPSLPPGPARIGIVGRILPKKGQRFFIEAAARVKEKIPKAEFYVIGEATEEFRNYEEELRALVDSLSLGSCFHWTGYLDEPLALMASLDVIVHAAVEPEPFGRVIIEALALARPIVATALGGPVEIIEDRISGFLVPPGDASAIAEKVLALLEDSELGSRMKAAALRRAEDFGIDSYIPQIEAVYVDALRLSKGRPT